MNKSINPHIFITKPEGVNFIEFKFRILFLEKIIQKKVETLIKDIEILSGNV